MARFEDEDDDEDEYEAPGEALPTPLRGVQFGPSALLQYSDTPLLRSPGFEHEDEHEAPGEARQALGEPRPTKFAYANPSTGCG